MRADEIHALLRVTLNAGPAIGRMTAHPSKDSSCRRRRQTWGMESIFHFPMRHGFDFPSGAHPTLRPDVTTPLVTPDRCLWQGLGRVAPRLNDAIDAELAKRRLTSTQQSALSAMPK
jgi:hypothetical protein